MSIDIVGELADKMSVDEQVEQSDEQDSALRHIRELGIVIVEWEDAMQSDGRWGPIEDVGSDAATCISVGVCLRNDNGTYTVMPHVIADSDDAEDQCCGEMIIPRSAIRHIWSAHVGRMDLIDLDKSEDSDGG